MEIDIFQYGKIVGFILIFAEICFWGVVFYGLKRGIAYKKLKSNS